MHSQVPAGLHVSGTYSCSAGLFGMARRSTAGPTCAHGQQHGSGAVPRSESRACARPCSCSALPPQTMPSTARTSTSTSTSGPSSSSRDYSGQGDDDGSSGRHCTNGSALHEMQRHGSHKCRFGPRQHATCTYAWSRTSIITTSITPTSSRISPWSCSQCLLAGLCATLAVDPLRGHAWACASTVPRRCLPCAWQPRRLARGFAALLHARCPRAESLPRPNDAYHAHQQRRQRPDRPPRPPRRLRATAAMPVPPSTTLVLLVQSTTAMQGLLPLPPIVPPPSSTMVCSDHCR